MIGLTATGAAPPPATSVARRVAAMWARVRAVLKDRPLLYNIPYYGTAIGAGDYLSQRIKAYNADDSTRATDWGEVARFAAYGSLWSAPVLTLWYGRIDKIVPTAVAVARAGAAARPAWLPTREVLASTAKKVALEQAVLTPIQVTTVFSWDRWWAGAGVDGVKAKLRSDMLPTWRDSIYFWGLVGAAMYSVIPVRARVVSAGVISVVWNTYLTFVATQEAPQPEASVRDTGGPALPSTTVVATTTAVP